MNFVAIGAAAVAAFIVAMIWYSPALFGKQWGKLVGKSAKEAEKMPPLNKLIVGFLLYLPSAYVLNMIFEMAAISTMPAAITATFFIWLGFIAVPGFSVAWFADTSKKLFLIDQGNFLLSGLAMAAVIITMGA